MRRIIDISLPVRDGGLVYPGNPDIHIAYAQAVARGQSANVSHVDFGSHTGTHVDAARHFFDDGEPIDQLPLERLIGPCRVLDFGEDVRAVGAAELSAHALAGVTRVLLKTRNSTYNTAPPFHPDYTYLAPDGAEYLVGLGVELVGIDYLSIEQFHSGHHLTHRTLLERRVAIVEGLALGGVSPGAYELICLPLRLAGIDGAPARAVLIADDATPAGDAAA